MRRGHLATVPGMPSDADFLGLRADDRPGRFHLTVVLAAVIGVLTGLAVAGFDVAVTAPIGAR